MSRNTRAIPALQHRFVPGLRFDTEVQVQRDGRWSDLPWPTDGDDSEHFRACIRQCLEVLGLSSRQLPAKDAVEWGDWQRDDLPRPLAWAKPMPGAVSIASLPCKSPAELWACAHLGIEAGAAGMLRLAGTSGVKRWVLLTGIEQVAQGKHIKPRSLLVLDPGLPRQWGCGHNARLHLQPAQAAHAYRGLDGDRSTVAVNRCLILRRE